MKPSKKTILNFTYMGTSYDLKITSAKGSVNYFIYEIRILYAKYILINDHNDWCFIADLQPCKKLKNIIIQKVKNHTTGEIRLKRFY
ncbi:hypothetical protein [Mucilaginibacter phyllosphaerae]|uniref:Uncharacterized protein n=1 Tax=Mucilaginibacter phyllosphaerae TaxID=1812349 RepID=A0A4Y8AB42_9SPHI|nr:hypothetical protein [Mucilaginibacter phyllosphaerae]MBB3969675.1 hypothetical protein [Mucilaginibacter phyllosphaerae]TEW65059.1 hypothetical protein E2R65_14175 [Mucilaginibacter phyllosphaerae]GGH18240.1 hypothetical protein GCM10007352_28820 [Mucilaginibacter phyllosphaerae]